MSTSWSAETAGSSSSHSASVVRFVNNDQQQILDEGGSGVEGGSAKERRNQEGQGRKYVDNDFNIALRFTDI